MAVGPICASYKPPPPRWGYLMVIERRSVPVRTLGPGRPVAFMRACRWIICAPSRTVLRLARSTRASIASSAATNSGTPSRSNSRVAMSRLPLGLGTLLPLRQALLDLLVDRQQPVAQRRRRGLRLGYGPAEGAAELVGAEVGGEAPLVDEGGVTSGAETDPLELPPRGVGSGSTRFTSAKIRSAMSSAALMSRSQSRSRISSSSSRKVAHWLCSSSTRILAPREGPGPVGADGAPLRPVRYRLSVDSV